MQIGLQSFSDNSELCGLHGSKDKVVVIMMEHTAKPNYFFKYSEAFGNFLLHMHSQQNAFPKSMDEFEKRFEMRFVMGSDPPIEKQRPYARGAYVKLHLAGKVIEVLDSFFLVAARKQNRQHFSKTRHDDCEGPWYNTLPRLPVRVSSRSARRWCQGGCAFQSSCNSRTCMVQEARLCKNVCAHGEHGASTI